MLGPGASAGRGGRDDNSEHEIPEYLVGRHNTEELIGELPRTVAGGVLGAKFRSAQFPRSDDDTGTGSER